MPTATIQVDSIKSDQNSSSISLVEGATIPSGKTISCAGNMNVVGILSVTSLSGSVSGFAPNYSKAYALNLIIADPPLRS